MSRRKPLDSGNNKSDTTVTAARITTRGVIIAGALGVIGVVATAVFSYLSTRTQVELPIQATQAAVAMLTQAASSVVHGPAPAETLSSPVNSNFDYLVRLEANNTGEPIANAKVTIEVIGQAPLDEITDSVGIARFLINTGRMGQPAKLIVHATGFRPYTRNIDLREGTLPGHVQLEKESLPAPSIVATENQSLRTPTPITALRPTSPSLGFETISLDSIANASLWNDYSDPPTGYQLLGNVQFDLDGRAFKSQAQVSPSDTYPTSGVVDIGIPNVEYVYLIVTAGNAYKRWDNETVGHIELVFDSAPPVDVDLVLGQNLREWHAADNVVSTAPNVQQVWQGAIAGHPDLTGTLDMLTIRVPADRHSATLKHIEFHDVSKDTARSLDPALIIAGMTVAHR